MSEILVKGVNALTVGSVDPGSAAHRAGIRPGDLIRTANGRDVLDVLDYRFHTADDNVVLGVDRGAGAREIRLRNSPGEDLGLEFETDLGDRVHTCKNKCVFCFIHQMPKKMRKSLYLMDDDFRLSFIHGNYVTLTNLSPDEWARILEQKLSPLYVSVHATDPELRATMLGRREPTPVLPQLRELARHGIDVHAQVVLCPGWNDGESLTKTVEELAREHPSQTGLRCGVLSVAVVPVGLTRFRERLPAIPNVERSYAREAITSVDALSHACRRQLGTRFVWLADEWFFLAGEPIPGRTYYEQFPQLEDGIGTVRLFIDEAARLSRRLPLRAAAPVRATVVTAEMPSGVLEAFTAQLNGIPGVNLNLCVVKNAFFGGDIRIAGLLTCGDIAAALQRHPHRHDTIVVPDICLRDGELFLDDMTVADLAAATGGRVLVSPPTPRGLAETLGLITKRTHPRPRGGWAMEETVVEPATGAAR